MQEILIDNYSFLRFTNLKSDHWITQKPFDMHKERGRENREKLIGLLDLKCQVVFPDQKHTGNVKIVESAKTEISYPNCDALITAKKDVPIGVVTADCVPIILEDKTNHVIAAVHAGWRGTVQNILGETIKKMVDVFNCNPHEIYAGIGPSISPEVYEVGDDVYKEFKEKGFPTELFFEDSSKKDKYYLDLWKANFWQLQKNGVPKKNVEISKMCTFTSREKLYSARRDTISTGRLAAIIKL